MPANAKVALFVDVESMHHRLRSLHHRYLDPTLLLETAAQHGELAASVAIGDWGSVPDRLKVAFEESAVETVQVDRAVRARESGGRRREVLRDTVDVEILAGMIELLFQEGGPEVDVFVLATGDACGVRTIGLLQDKFSKLVRVIGVEGTISEEIEQAADGCESLPMPALEPADLEGLERLVPMLEELERRKRYLNFKYIRESVVRRLDLPKRSFDAAERLLCDAIGCGLLLKLKVEDKSNEGQQFTAYALNRESELFERFGSGEPAPEHEDKPPETQASVPSLGKRGRRDKREKKPEPPKAQAADSAEPGRNGVGRSDREEGGRGRKRRRRRRRRGAPESQESVQLSAGGAASKKKTKKRGRGRGSGRGGNHQQDRVGRSYEAPSRFIMEEDEVVPQVNDEDIDEDRILRALGNL